MHTHTYIHAYIHTHTLQQAGNSPEEAEEDEFATPNKDEFATPNKEFDDASVTAKAASEPFWQQRLQGQQVCTCHTLVAQGP
jgi:hypothetical protein